MPDNSGPIVAHPVTSAPAVPTKPTVPQPLTQEEIEAGKGLKSRVYQKLLQENIQAVELELRDERERATQKMQAAFLELRRINKKADNGMEGYSQYATGMMEQFIMCKLLNEGLTAWWDNYGAVRSGMSMVTDALVEKAQGTILEKPASLLQAIRPALSMLKDMLTEKTYEPLHNAMREAFPSLNLEQIDKYKVRFETRIDENGQLESKVYSNNVEQKDVVKFLNIGIMQWLATQDYVRQQDGTFKNTAGEVLTDERFKQLRGAQMNAYLKDYFKLPSVEEVPPSPRP